MKAATLALVESPVQLLHTLEWCHSAGAALDTTIAVLAPRDEVGRRQLQTMLGYAEEEGIAATWFNPRRPSELPGALLRLRRAVARADRLLVGDPFSGVIQALLPAARAADVVVLDDGTATIDFTSRLVDGRPLERWNAHSHGAGEWVRHRLGSRAGAILDAGGGRRVSIFTVMPHSELSGLGFQPNRYEWSRRRFAHPEVIAGTDVVGSSLVETGLVERAAYLAAVASLAATGGRYLAHRREADDKLAEVAARTGLEVVRPEAPLEVEVRRGPVAQLMVSFPSSVCFSLPVVLAGVSVELRVLPVEPGWLREHVGAGARDFLASLGRRSGLPVQPSATAGAPQRGTKASPSEKLRS